MLLHQLLENELIPPVAMSITVAKLLRELLSIIRPRLSGGVIRPSTIKLLSVTALRPESGSVDVVYAFDKMGERPLLSMKDFRALCEKFDIPGALAFSTRVHNYDGLYIIEVESYGGYKIDAPSFKTALKKEFSNLKKVDVGFL